jgi:hypothetical protein
MSEPNIIEDKTWRRDLDNCVQLIRQSDRESRERSLAVTKIQEAIMWLGMDLKAINDGKSCYRHGYDPESTKVEPTADGLKM